uniref:Carboxypeptidase B2 n=1 Tax=Denticeps clupeoides TaxID=299321 RepID=A0AAY4EFC9_9TELE
HLIYSDQVLSIIAKTPAEVDILRNMSTQHETVLWQPASARHIKPDTEVHLYIPKHHVQNVTDLLKTHLLAHRVLLQDTQELIAMQTRNHTSDPRSSETFYERYHSLEDIYYWINRTITDNPDRAKVILIGSSYEKRPLYVLKLSGRKSNDAKKAMWIDCGIHARDDCIGTDLNRNFDANWCTEGASDYPCEEIYCGQFPESEPESRAVANFLRSHKDTVKLYFSIHSYSQMLLFPYSCSYEQAQNHDELLALVQEAAQNIRRYYRNQYKYGAGAKTIYLAPGGSDDWAYKMGIEYSFTFELQDRGTYGFLLPPSYITKASKEAALAVKGITLRVIQKKQWASPPQS